ncbi:hypothetical protein [Cyanobacterium aponinum]|uniref:Uncharacterized protein n=1 Tax=Cyanobacterium aponinum 0216 TaxID=2676140 RepID=A0A844GXJ8_9CHRO|nr:hypothetical protein [Cyanobacterium aponinum]MTF38905.1 hypothetical protein [Cyanobacterium aponinum 0216]
MKDNRKQIHIGDAVKVKGKLYLVWDIKGNHIFGRQFTFTKTGRFQHYQDRIFSVNICQLANQKEKQIINEQRKQASIQQKSYSPIGDNYTYHLIR